MAAQCIVITPSLYTEIAAQHEPEPLTLEDLCTSIAGQAYGTGFKGLNADIRALVPMLDLLAAIAASFLPDIEGPVVIPQTYPLNQSGGIGVYGPIYVVVEDGITGIDLGTLEMIVNAVTYTQDSSEVVCLPINPPYRYVVRFVPATPWTLGSTVTVSMFVKDRAGNPGLNEAVV